MAAPLLGERIFITNILFLTLKFLRQPLVRRFVSNSAVGGKGVL